SVKEFAFTAQIDTSKPCGTIPPIMRRMPRADALGRRTFTGAVLWATLSSPPAMNEPNTPSSQHAVRTGSVPTFETGGPPTTGRAVDDIGEGLREWELWLSMAWQDIKQRYRGSMLGPFWVTLSMGVMVGALSFVYGQ